MLKQLNAKIVVIEEEGRQMSGPLRFRVKAKRQRVEKYTFTLVEMTIILSVIAILSAILVPTVMSHVTRSQIIRARQDVKAIGNAINRFYDDVGFVPTTSDSIDGGPGENEIDMMIGPGELPLLPTEPVPVNASTATAAAVLPATVNPSQMNDWLTGTADFFSNHLVNNIPGYDLKGGEEQRGWNGPYLSSAPAADPWSMRYMMNVAFMEPSAGVVSADGLPKRAVFVLSAGPNRIVETAFDQAVTSVVIGGDDIVHRMQ